MAQNPSISQLDGPQIIKRVFDQTNDSVRVDFAGVHSTAINLSATDTSNPDSIINYPVSLSTKASLTSASTGTVIGPVSCVGMKSFNIYTVTTATITGSQALTLQVSPSDSDNVWIAVSCTATPSTTNAVVVKGTTEVDIVARRAQVVIAAAITSGTADAYLVMQGV